jgi:hypothetical protein
MAKSATEAKIRELSRQLEAEKRDHARTRNELQAEITRWQRLARPNILDLMGVYPPLRKLLNVLAEAADLQDPSRGSPIEDTMRTEYVAVGDRASTSSTERGVLTHARARHNVRVISGELEHLRSDFNARLDDKTHWLAKLVGGEEWEYPLPDKPICHRKDCSHRGRKQGYRSWFTGCPGCGRSFDGRATLAG